MKREHIKIGDFSFPLLLVEGTPLNVFGIVNRAIRPDMLDTIKFFNCDGEELGETKILPDETAF